MVKEQIPQCFDGYLRLFHPPLDESGLSTTWNAVARTEGKKFHPQAQWKCLVSRSAPLDSGDQSWAGTRPDLGELPYPELDRLCRTLARYTADPDHVFFGLSTVHGRVEPLAESKDLLRLPRRDFVIFTGPLSAAGEIGFESPESSEVDRDHSEASVVGGDGAQQSRDTSDEDANRHIEDSEAGSSERYLARDVGQAPNLIWAADRAWFVASEVDFDSTLIGGSNGLIDDLLRDRHLETAIVLPEDSLAEDADRFNC